jgi:hypothetical protein
VLTSSEESTTPGEKSLNTAGKKTLAGAAYAKIKADVTGGVFEPGQRLRIEDLRQAYGTGASPLREALSRLAAEGIVVSIGQRGFRVPPVSVEELRDITNMRILLETEALRQSIEHGDDEWEAEVVASFHRLSKAETGSGADNIDVIDTADATKTAGPGVHFDDFRIGQHDPAVVGGDGLLTEENFRSAGAYWVRRAIEDLAQNGMGDLIHEQAGQRQSCLAARDVQVGALKCTAIRKEIAKPEHHTVIVDDIGVAERFDLRRRDGPHRII